ncbi:RICIN domain-containing protein [Kitasatospora sp. NBC_01539]|uniref:RICIN domain-containing protein n=1 Tax=Kitasatospora sp. NBC_01539 TaxID=2903577 RepID=UPI003860246D
MGGAGHVRDGSYRLRNVATGLLLEVPGGSTRSGAKVVLAAADGSDAQVWRISAVHAGAGLYHLENAASGKRLDVAGARTEDGVPLQQWAPNAFGAQEWVFEQHVEAPGTYTVVAFVSGRVMEAAQDGSVRQWEDRDDPAQWWRPEAL